MNLVIDASALVAATVSVSTASQGLRQRLGVSSSHAPYLIDAELGNVLRRLVFRGVVPLVQAEALLLSAPLLVDHRHDHRGALARMAWSLRDNLTFYDALYVALATSLDAVLITADAKLAGAPQLPCDVHVLAAVT